MALGTGTIISMIGTGLGVLGTIGSFIGGKICGREKEQRETEALIANDNERWDKWIADKSSEN